MCNDPARHVQQAQVAPSAGCCHGAIADALRLQLPPQKKAPPAPPATLARRKCRIDALALGVVFAGHSFHPGIPYKATELGCVDVVPFRVCPASPQCGGRDRCETSSHVPPVDKWPENWQQLNAQSVEKRLVRLSVPAEHADVVRHVRLGRPQLIAAHCPQTRIRCDLPPEAVHAVRHGKQKQRASEWPPWFSGSSNVASRGWLAHAVQLFRSVHCKPPHSW